MRKLISAAAIAAVLATGSAFAQTTVKDDGKKPGVSAQLWMWDSTLGIQRAGKATAKATLSVSNATRRALHLSSNVLDTKTASIDGGFDKKGNVKDVRDGIDFDLPKAVVKAVRRKSVHATIRVSIKSTPDDGYVAGPSSETYEKDIIISGKTLLGFGSLGARDPEDG